MGDTRQGRELLQRNFAVLGCFTLRGEDGLRRAAFPSSWKSSQKSRKKPMVSSLPCVLCIVQGRDCQPHVHRKCPFSLCYRIVSAPAPLPLMPSTVEPQALFITPANSSGARLLRVSLRASSQTGAGSDPSAGQWQMKRSERVTAVKNSAVFTPLRNFGYRNRKSVPLKRTNLLLSSIASAAAAPISKQ